MVVNDGKYLDARAQMDIETNGNKGAYYPGFKNDSKFQLADVRQRYKKEIRELNLRYF